MRNSRELRSRRIILIWCAFTPQFLDSAQWLVYGVPGFLSLSCNFCCFNIGKPNNKMSSFGSAWTVVILVVAGYELYELRISFSSLILSRKGFWWRRYPSQKNKTRLLNFWKEKKKNTQVIFVWCNAPSFYRKLSVSNCLPTTCTYLPIRFRGLKILTIHPYEKTASQKESFFRLNSSGHKDKPMLFGDITSILFICFI